MTTNIQYHFFLMLHMYNIILYLYEPSSHGLGVGGFSIFWRSRHRSKVEGLPQRKRDGAGGQWAEPRTSYAGDDDKT